MPSEEVEKNDKLPKVNYGSGGMVTSKTPSPRTIKAMTHQRREMARVYIGGGVVVLLAIAAIAGFLLRVDGVNVFLPIVSMGVGSLLGSPLRGDNDDS
jgi:hypothetical protein